MERQGEKERRAGMAQQIRLLPVFGAPLPVSAPILLGLRETLSFHGKTVLSFPGCPQVKDCLVLKVKDKVALPQLKIRF